MKDKSNVGHYTVVSTDLYRSSRGGSSRQKAVGNAANQAIKAASQLWRDSKDWIFRDGGDGDNVLIPATVGKPWQVSQLLLGTWLSLEQFNFGRPRQGRARLRVGMACGDVHVQPEGFAAYGYPRAAAGDALTVAARLRASTVVDALMAEFQDLCLVVLISDGLYRDGVLAADDKARVPEFQCITSESSHGFAEKAWIYAPNHSQELRRFLESWQGSERIPVDSKAKGVDEATHVTGVAAKEITGGHTIGNVSGGIYYGHLMRRRDGGNNDG